MKPLKIFLLTSLILVHAMAVGAQDVRLFSTDASNGQLSSSLVNKIVQDSKGYIWIATENGLNLFDGTRFRTYYKGNEGSSLLSSYVRTVHESSDGRIRVGCINGLMEYDPRTDSFSKIPMYVGGKEVMSHVYDICELSSGEIWIATAGAGILSYDVEKNEARGIEKLSKLVGSDLVSSIYEDSSHVVWIGTENRGLSRYYPSSGKVRCYRMPEIPGNVVQCFIESEQGDILVGTLDGGICRYNRRTERFETVPSDLPRTDRVVTMVNYEGKILVGTDGNGVQVYENGRVSRNLEIPSAPDGGRQLKVLPILKDRDGNLWLGLYQRGVVCVPRKRYKFNTFGKILYGNNPIGDNCVMAILGDKDQSLWISCDNEGVYHVDREGHRLAFMPMPSTVMCLMRDSDDKLWAGTYTKGAYVLENGAWRGVPELSDRKITCMVQGPDGTIYIGSLDRGLESFDPVTHTVTDCLKSENCRNISDASNVLNCVNYLMMTDKGDLWVAHYNGISRYDTVKHRFVRTDGKLNLVESVVGYSLMEDRDHGIWMGTSSGLYHYEKGNGKMKLYTTSDGLPSNMISGLCQDSQGDIWISTYHGIASLKLSEGKVYVFDAGDGLQGNEFTHGAYFKDDRGTIFFGGNRGVTGFHPNDFEWADERYTPVITEFGAYRAWGNGKEGTYEVIRANCGQNDRIELASDENSIRIFFSTLTYDNPSKVVFEYNLSGGDKWIRMEPGQNMVTFYNLAPGTYEFSLRVASNPSDVRKLRIVILPPWYLSWPMKIVYSLMLLSLCVLAWYIARQHRRAKMEIVRQQHAEEKAEAKMKIFTDFSHSLRTPMTLIVDPMRKLISKCQDDTVKQTYTLIYNNALRVMELTNNLVDYPGFKPEKTVNEREGQPVMEIDWNALAESHGDRQNSKVVIVEQDDEFREYMLHVLQSHYRNVAAFSNADQAYGEILIMNPLPDAIVSAVIMEGTDGVDFTRKLKRNAQLNHIPVILLSAKSEARNVKEAIESGADNCLVKPVSSEVLLSTIQTVLGNRHLLKVKFSGNQEQEDKIQKIVLKSADEVLMKRIMETINKNLGNSEFSVEMLAETVGMSRAHLHRKLKELTNLSARDFIRSIRMRQAASLLTENNLTVAEVAYAVGFANASHFSTVFKDFYGKTPTQYMEIQSNIAKEGK